MILTPKVGQGLVLRKHLHPTRPPSEGSFALNVLWEIHRSDHGHLLQHKIRRNALERKRARFLQL